MTDHGHFHWNELMTHDAEAAKAFYGDLAGWTFDGMDMGDGLTYWVGMNGGKPAGGIFPMSGTDFDSMPPQWMAYLAVDDIDACIEKAKTAGAEIVKPAFDIPGVGRIAMLKDPSGAVLGWMTPASES
ncbi:MAG: VOC family protein [Geminicoccaceae bacterium]